MIVSAIWSAKGARSRMRSKSDWSIPLQASRCSMVSASIPAASSSVYGAPSSIGRPFPEKGARQWNSNQKLRFDEAVDGAIGAGAVSLGRAPPQERQVLADPGFGLVE